MCIYMCIYVHIYEYEYIEYICVYEYYLAMRKDEILPFSATWMELEGIMLSEISQSEKDRYHMFSLVCGT